MEKPARERLNIFSDLVKKGKYVTLERRAEDRTEWQKLKTAERRIQASQ